jgi:YfiH family protein
LSKVAEHGFTTRQLALRGGVEARPAEWTAVAALVRAPADRLVSIRQVHGRAIRVIERGRLDPDSLRQPYEADAIVSSEPGLALVVQVADCVPILLADRRAGVAAAVHAGWRGTAAGIAGEAMLAMTMLGATPSDVVAAIGPSNGPCCYEVGDELIAAFLDAGRAGGDVERWFSRVPLNGRTSLRLDVALANRDQLAATGMPAGQIHLSGLCTQTHRAVFDSYRAEGAAAGRMAAVIRVPPALGA